MLKVKLKVLVVKNLEGSNKDTQLWSIKIMSNVKYNLGAKIILCWLDLFFSVLFLE